MVEAMNESTDIEDGIDGEDDVPSGAGGGGEHGRELASEVLVVPRVGLGPDSWQSSGYERDVGAEDFGDGDVDEGPDPDMEFEGNADEEVAEEEEVRDQVEDEVVGGSSWTADEMSLAKSMVSRLIAARETNRRNKGRKGPASIIRPKVACVGCGHEPKDKTPGREEKRYWKVIVRHFVGCGQVSVGAVHAFRSLQSKMKRGFDLSGTYYKAQLEKKNISYSSM